MSVEVECNADGTEVTIKVSEKFDFSLHRTFREAYKDCNATGARFHVDLSEAEYMDSSALGMLLLLREHAESLGGDVDLRNPSASIRKVLTVANFDKLFTIVEDEG